MLVVIISVIKILHLECLSLKSRVTYPTLRGIKLQALNYSI